jgi:zinc transport system substrate-binding protein
MLLAVFQLGGLMRRALGLALIVVSVFTFLTCKSRSSGPSTGKITIIVTIPPLADFARQIGRDRVEVTTLLAPGASPHTFEPTPSLANAAAEADLFVRIGLDLDHWVQGLLPTEVPVIIAAELEGIEIITETGHHEGANPHIWLDPLYAAIVSTAIAEELVKIDSQGSQAYQKNLAVFLAKLDSLHTNIEAVVDSFASRKYVSFHPAWAYFARRYRLERVAVIAESPGKEPTPRHLEEVVKTIKSSGAKTVFAEPQLSPKAAEVIAEEAGIEVLFLDPLGKENEGYIDLMERNVTALKGAMGER